MLLEEHPAELIRSAISNFSITRDKQAITNISDSLSTLSQARELHLADATSSLRKLSRRLNALQAHNDELGTLHSSKAHATAISELDTQKFRTAKAVSDLEMEIARLGSTLREMNVRLQELEMQGVEGDVAGLALTKDPVEDEVLLRLKVYRSLGVELERDGADSNSREPSNDSELGDITRAIVRNDRKGTAHVINLDPKFSRFFYANYFWNML